MVAMTTGDAGYIKNGDFMDLILYVEIFAVILLSIFSINACISV